MPIFYGQSIKNKAEIIHNAIKMQKVYVGERLVWQKITWILLAEFQTNSPETTTFDPSISRITGDDYKWDLGDGTIITGGFLTTYSITHTYTDSSTKTVKLFVKGACSIDSIAMNSDNLVGALNLSHSAFSSLESIILQNNVLMTGVVLPPLMSGEISMLDFSSTGIQGTLDLSMMTKFSDATIVLATNPSMTGVLFAPSITGTISSLNIYSSAIQGVLNLSMMTTFSAALIQLQNSPSMTGVVFAPSITGTISTLNIFSTGIQGVLNLSMMTAFSAGAHINLFSNPSMTGVTFAASVTGTIAALSIYNCPSVGYVDLTGFITGTNINNCIIRLDGNAWTAAIVNHILHDLNSISAAGYTGRQILIGGTNADPDATSGGYDGLTEKAALEGKGFIVGI